MISRIRGTRDIITTRVMNYALKKIIKKVEQYNFQHIILPVLESVDLFKRSLGTETDVVNKELFVVHSSSAESKETICLRPEATAQTVRAFVQEGIQNLPWKTYSYGSMFRYERPQKGRYREFYQFNMEIIGTECMAQDAQLIALLDQLFMESFQLESYALYINFLGMPDERVAFKKELDSFLEKHLDAICETCVKRKSANILRVFDCKEKKCQDIYYDAPTIIDSLGESSQKEWQQLQDFLSELSVSFVYNPRLVRGLDYYNKTVFEFASPDLGAQSAFCGGGRYDQLVAEIGGKKDQPAIGAAIGIDRLCMLLEMNQDNLALPEQSALTIIIPFGEEQHSIGLQLNKQLSSAGKCTQLLTSGSVKSMMKRANKLGAKQCILIGEQEQQDGTVVLKNMTTGEEQSVRQFDVLSLL